MAFKTFLTSSAAILSIAALASSASAQTVETTNRIQFDCSHDDEDQKLAAIGNLGGVAKQVTDKRRKKYALKAAKKALKAGYNYAYMEPLEKTDSRRRVCGDGTFSSAWCTTIGKKGRSLTCVAFDDVGAYTAVLEENVMTKRTWKTGGFVDLRKLYEQFEGKPYGTARKPQIAAENFVRTVGSRERTAAQYPVMMQALSCAVDLQPTSIRDFSFTPTDAAKAQEAQCLRNMESQAAAVGLDFTRLKRSTADDLGFTINSSAKDIGTTQMTGISSRPFVDTGRWGQNWRNHSADFAGFDGIALFNDASDDTIILASNTLSETELLNYSVYMSAQSIIDASSKNNKVTLVDKTKEFKAEFNEARERHSKKEYNNAAKAANNSEGTVTQSKIGYKEQDLASAREKLAKASEPYVEDPQNFSELEATFALYPNADVNIEDVKRQMRDAVAQGHAIRKTKYAQKVAELERELAEMQATFARETQEKTQQAQSLPSQSTLASSYRPSEKESPTSKSKAVYYAMENYSTVLITAPSSGPYDGCSDNYIVCADKLQAYNTLGGRLNASGFTALSTPIGYEPYRPE